jgi:hypothetical protein
VLWRGVVLFFFLFLEGPPRAPKNSAHANANATEAMRATDDKGGDAGVTGIELADAEHSSDLDVVTVCLPEEEKEEEEKHTKEHNNHQHHDEQQQQQHIPNAGTAAAAAATTTTATAGAGAREADEVMPIGHLRALRMAYPAMLTVTGGDSGDDGRGGGGRGSGVRLQSVRELREEFDEQSRVCRVRGARLLVFRGRSGQGAWAVGAGVALVTWCVAAACVVLYNLTFSESGGVSRSAIGAVSAVEAACQVGMYYFWLFFLYPNVCRSRRLVVFFWFIAVLWVVTYVVSAFLSLFLSLSCSW